MFPTAAPRRSLRRASAIALATVLLVGLAPYAVPHILAATKVAAGYRDFQYGDPVAPGGDDVTASRMQSKLWHHDGRWWGLLFDSRTTPNAKFRIWSFDMATQDWTSTGVAVDDRNRSHADALAVGNTLYVASARAELALSTGRDLRIYRYTYNPATHVYAVAAGFPKLIAGTSSGTGYSTIARDTDGRLWVAFTQANRVRITSSGDDGVTWDAPFDVPGHGNDITSTDVAAIAPLSGSGASGVGVLWSSQNPLDDAFYFAAHVDGQPVGTWSARETAFGVPESAFDADGHMSVKTDASGNLIAAIKTGRNDDPAPNGGDPLIAVLRRTGSPAVAGTWTSHTVTTVTVDGTRPILVLDAVANEANVFLTYPTLAATGAQAIYRRTAPLSTLDFGTAAIGTQVIASATELAINDATSTKQVATGATGMLVAATNIPTLQYFHACIGGPCPQAPVANFTSNVTSGPAPLTVQFTDTSTNAPTAWSWTFGDGGTSTAQNPSHVYVDPGTYTVSLTASNVVGSDDETKTNYITVQQPPDTAYFEIAPVRFLDSRNGIGLGGTFKPNVPRTLSIAGANGIPGDAVAITGNLTVTDQTRSGYLSITPDAVANPETSALNFPLGDTRANGVTVPLNSSGDLSIVYKNGLTTGSTHVLLDVTGYFRVSTGGSTYHAVAPVRVLDSRSGKGLSGTFKPSVPRQLTVGGTPGIPANAVAITANLTVTDQTRRGFLSITPTANANPNTSSLNFPLGDIRANGVTVPLTGSPGTLWIVYKNGLTTGSTHVLLDVTGYFTAGTGGATFVPVTPARILDTRSGNGLAGTFKAAVPRTWQAWTRGGIATNADAVVGNVTVVGQTRRGYVAITPTPVVTPNTSTINFPVGDIRANNLTVQLSGTGSMSGVYNTGAGGSTHVLFDVFGYYK